MGIPIKSQVKSEGSGGTMKRKSQRATVLNRIKRRRTSYKKGTLEEQEEQGF